MRGYAVSRLWPDDDHDLLGFGASRRWVQLNADLDRLRWRGLWRPVLYAVIPISREAYEAHRRAGTCLEWNCAATREGVISR